MFLKYNQDKLIKKYGLKHDEEYLYLKYIETEYRSIAETVLLNMPYEEWTDCREYTAVMTIYGFSFLFQAGDTASFTGQWQPVGRFVTAGSSPSTDPL